MDSIGYTTLARQSGLIREMDGVAQNVANMSTTGYRRGGVIFSEFVQDLGPDAPSLSMAAGRVRTVDVTPAPLIQTDAPFDLAIEGDGFFQVATPAGDRLTRNGAFIQSAAGELVTAEGYQLLDQGGAPVFAPPDARAIVVASDGTLSADGQPLAQIGLFVPENALDLQRIDGVLLEAPGGVVPLDGGRIRQGALEGSNVDPVTEIARMIEVQRAYELGQNFLDKEDERIRGVLQTLGR